MTAKAMIRRLDEAVKDVRAMGAQSFLTGEAYRGACRGTLSQVLGSRMQARLDERLLRSKQAGVADRRNGSYRRHLLTEIGDVELTVPRTRRYAPVEVLQRYARRAHTVDRVILACFVLGLSTRKVARTLLPILGEPVSPSTVSQVAKTLDAAVNAFHKRALEDRYRALLLDGVCLSRKTGTGAVRRPVLVVMGILPDGKKEVIAFHQAKSESQAGWEALLNDLYRRGLKGKLLEVIGVDGGKGLLAALPLVYPRVPVQRCWAHKIRNILNHCRKADWQAVKRSLHKVMDAKNLISARKAAQRFCNQWLQPYPGAVACLKADLDSLLTCYRFSDREWRKRIRTTNLIERCFVEVRRRTRPMGVFFDENSVDRILYAVFTHFNQCQCNRILFPLTQNS